MRELHDEMTDQTTTNTNLSEKLKDILQALNTEEGQKELRKLAQSLDAVKLKENGSDHDNGYVHVAEGNGDSNASYSPSVSISTIENWEKTLLSEPKNKLALSALSANEAKNVLTRRSTKIADTQKFNIKIKLEGAPITNQKSSGRCWLFAATNVFRVAIMKKYNLKEFQFSQSYLFFWDKLEKANYYLEQIIDTADEDLDGRLVQTLMAAPVGDGGQWDMLANLVEKYGLVPHDLYPDAHSATSSRTMGSLITTKLREYALELRQLMKANSSSSPSSSRPSSLGPAKARMLREIHGILVLMLGPPPNPNEPLTWEYYNKDDEFQSLKTTPITFAEELSSQSGIEALSGTDIHQLFSLVNDPRNPYGEHLSVSRLGNVIGMRDVRYVNVDMKTMKDACIAMLKSDIPIFFGSDVGKFSERESGIMDTDLIDYELGFNISLGMSKAQRLKTGESAMTHAMVLTAVHLDEGGKPIRWRVQNSWGEGSGSKGWFVMSDRWMDEFVYQAVVDPRFVSKEVRDVLGKKPRMLELWDPMGALA